MSYFNPKTGSVQIRKPKYPVQTKRGRMREIRKLIAEMDALFIPDLLHASEKYADVVERLSSVMSGYYEKVKLSEIEHEKKKDLFVATLRGLKENRKSERLASLIVIDLQSFARKYCGKRRPAWLGDLKRSLGKKKRK